MKKHPLSDGWNKVHSCLETVVMEQECVVVVSGYPQLHQFINYNYCILNKKKQISVALGIFNKLFSHIVAW